MRSQKPRLSCFQPGATLFCERCSSKSEIARSSRTFQVQVQLRPLSHRKSLDTHRYSLTDALTSSSISGQQKSADYLFREPWPVLSNTSAQHLGEATAFAQRCAGSSTSPDPIGIGRRILCRATLKEFLRLKLYLHSDRHITSRIGLNHRKQPTLILSPGGETEIGTQPVIVAHTYIGQSATSRDKLLTYFLMSVIKL